MRFGHTFARTISCHFVHLQAGFSRYKESISYGSSIVGQSMFGLTYILDMILVADIFVSMKKAIVTPTGIHVQNTIKVATISHNVISVYQILTLYPIYHRGYNILQSHLLQLYQIDWLYTGCASRAAH